jgi:hypothetical protein
VGRPNQPLQQTAAAILVQRDRTVIEAAPAAAELARSAAEDARVSVALFIVTERKVRGVSTDVSGKALGRSSHLDKLAKRAGVRPLMDLFSEAPDEAAEMAEELGRPVPKGGFPPLQWHPAEDGLASVRGMLAHLAAHPDAIPHAPAVADDLREFEAVLGGLAAKGVRWHLAVDY